MTTTIYRDYWSSAPTSVAPEESYQLLWVRRAIQHERARREALRAQWIEQSATY